MVDPLVTIATTHRLVLQTNPYPGRGIVIGMDHLGENLVQVYWIMGRSEDSRNRMFVRENSGSVRTALVDQSKKPQNPELILYRAMAEVPDDVYIVSNGNQTDPVLEGHQFGNSFYCEVSKFRYEPDVNHTPRITAIVYLDNGRPITSISVLKCSRFGDSCDNMIFTYEELRSGLGYCVTTYKGDAPQGQLLPAFEGEPYLLPFAEGGAQQIAEHMWAVLNESNRVALAVKTINIQNGKSTLHVINKYSATV